MADKEKKAGKKADKKLDWFDMYIEAVMCAREAGYQLYGMMTVFENIEQKSAEIKDLEHKGDGYLHDFFEKLTNAFITPVDRDAMGDMMRSIDNITDSIEHSASKFIIYDIKQVRPEAVVITETINECLAALVEASVEFRNYKRSTRLRELIIEVNRLEEQGDLLYRKAVSNLFRSPENVLDVVRWKDIFDTMEDVLDSCEDVADYMETVLLMVG
jgi:uncharacterized protein